MSHHPRVRIVTERGNASSDLVKVIEKPAIGVKRGMTWSGTRFHGRECRLVCRQTSLGGIEVIDEQLVQAQVVRDHEPVVGRYCDVMRMRSFLPFCIRAVTRVLNNR